MSFDLVILQAALCYHAFKRLGWLHEAPVWHSCIIVMPTIPLLGLKLASIGPLALRALNSFVADSTRRRRRRQKTGAGDSLFVRLNNTIHYAYSNEDLTK